MATEFQLPDLAPPGHMFPSRTGTPTQAGKSLALAASNLKIDTRHVVIAVAAVPAIEQIQPPPPARVIETQPSTPVAAPPPQRIDNAGAQESRTTPEGHSQSSSATLVQGAAGNAVDERSPVMRSMFPQLNPAIPVTQQQYYPTLEGTVPVIPAARGTPQYSPSLYSEPRSPPQAVLASDPWTASRIPSTIFNASPLRITEEPSAEFSSAEQLLDLWSIANGEGSIEAAEAYTLGLNCTSLHLDHEVLSLAPSSSSAVYTLHASGSTVVLTRSHPLDPSKEITVCNPTLSAPSVIHPELATFFPTSAELQAIDTASTIAATHHLPRQESIRLQTEALDRARRTEAATLLWDSDSATYYFSIPTLNPPPDTADSAGTNTATTPPQPLPIEITPNTSIRFLTSTAQPILTLSLPRKSLTLHTATITTLASSPYTLDVLLSGLLTLLLHLNRHTGLLSASSSSSNNQTLTNPHLPLPHFDPPPTRLSSHRSSPSNRKRSTTPKPKPSTSTTTPSRWLSLLHPSSSTTPHRANSALSHHTTLSTSPFQNLHAPPSPALSHTPSRAPTSFTMHTIHTLPPHLSSASIFEKDLEASLPHPLSQSLPPISTSGVAPELRATNTGVDLSRFQAYDLEDPELSWGVKSALRILYWGFGVLVWVLGVVIGVVAAGIVGVGGCIGGGGRERMEGGREG